MKIPIFEEILLNEVISENFILTISDSNIGKVPCYLNLSNLNRDDADDLIMNLEQIFSDHNRHPHFPYPFYIITPHKIQSVFPTAFSVKDLPEYYFKKVKRPNNKELQLLNKLCLKADKIKNLALYKIINDFKQTATSQRELYNITKELYFLENLNTKLAEKVKKTQVKKHE